MASVDGQIPTPSVKQTVALKRCPAPTAVFTGRDKHIKQVETCIIGSDNERRVCVVHGLGGAGKTQIALKTIERNREKWTNVLYIDASSRDSIEGTLQDFAKSKQFGKTHEDALSWLEFHREEWLMVFDNADHPPLNIHNYFPGGSHGSILITTRLPDLAIHAQGPEPACHVSAMSPQESLALLLTSARMKSQKLTEGETKAATTLLEVGCRACNGILIC